MQGNRQQRNGKRSPGAIRNNASTRTARGAPAGNLSAAGGSGPRGRAFFRVISQATATAVGTSWAFGIAVFTIVIWLASGPLFGFSDTWQLVINTGTTIVTFLMVFLVQNTQNRDASAVHLKLDELLRAVDHARNELIDVEEAEDAAVEQFKQELRDVQKVEPQ